MNRLRKKMFLSLHYNVTNSFLYANDKEIHQFKAKEPEIEAYPLCLGNITVNDMKVLD